MRRLLPFTTLVIVWILSSIVVSAHPRSVMVSVDQSTTGIGRQSDRSLPPLTRETAVQVPEVTSPDSWRSCTSMPSERYGLGVAGANNGKVYAVGGDGQNPQGAKDIVEEYDPATDAWSLRASMPTARQYLGVAAAPNGKIYAIGGYDYVNYLATVEEYDPATDTWTTRANMPTPRSSISVAAATNGKIYAIGGDNTGGPTTSVEEYDPEMNTWAVRASLPTPRYGLAAVGASNGKIYAIGGFGSMHRLDEYDPATDTWTTRASMPTGRAYMGVAAGNNGRIYVIGGYTPGNSFNAMVEEYDPETNTWTVRADMPTPRSSLGATAASNGRIYAVGGYPNLAAVEEYTLPLDFPTCNPSKQPVLLIHGWGGEDSLTNDNMGFAQLYGWMAEDGYLEGCNLFYATGVYATNSPDENRLAVRNNLRAAYDQLVFGYPNWQGHFDIIGHSYGGLNARFYLESPYYQEDQDYGQLGIHIDNLFTLGSPHGGAMIPEEAYWGAGYIAWGHILQPKNFWDFVSAAHLLDSAMEGYNVTHRQPEDTCYRLIGGDFLRQDNVPGLIRGLYLPWTFWNRGDIGVSLRSSGQLATNPLLWPLYPHVSSVINDDMHGYVTDWDLADLQSYVRPANTYTSSIRPFLGASVSRCYPTGRVTEDTGAAVESPFIPPILLGDGELAAGQTISDVFPVNWEGRSVFYASWAGGDADLTLVDAHGTLIDPAQAQIDPNIGYDKLLAPDGGVATYIFTDTLPGLWSYFLSAMSELYPITYTMYANADTVLVAQAVAPESQPMGTCVVLTATVTADGVPVTGAVMTATVTKPQGNSAIIFLQDDGLDPDPVAGDGVYAGLFEETDQGGFYRAWLEVEGSFGNREYQRTTEAVFAISPASATLRQTYADQPADQNGDGLYEYLDLAIGISAIETGTYGLSTMLVGTGNEYIDLANTLADITTTGVHTFTLRLSGESIRASGLDGPYRVAAVTLLDDETFIELDKDDSGYLTAAYDHLAFGIVHTAYLPLVVRGH